MSTPGKTTRERGYGTAHKNLRKSYEKLVASGEALCWRCLENGLPEDQARIDPTDDWDLGHDDHDRTKYRGPEHVACNRGAPSRAKAGVTGPAFDHSRTW